MYWISDKESAKALDPAVNSGPAQTSGIQPGTGKEGNSQTPVPNQTVNPEKGQEGNGGDGAESGGNAKNGTGGPIPNGSHTPKSSVKLTFVGDVIFASKVEDLLKKNGWDYPYHYVKDYLDKADITVANLETPISTRGTPQSKEYVYRSSPEALPAFKAAGFDLVNTSNNHILDYGQDALLDTMDFLDKSGIKRVGTGRNSEEAYRHVIMEHNGIKVAFLGFSRVVPSTGWFAGKQKPGLAETYSTKLPLEAITKAREEADLVVVIAHWGVERKDRPVKEQTDLAHQYIDQGADLVVASHPHVLQGFEQYKGKWIAYSLGNFIFTTNNEPATWESMILNATCTKERACELQMIPMLTKGAQPIRMTDEDGAKLFDKMSRLSVNARLDKDGKISEGPPVAAPATVPAPKPAPKTPPKKPAESSPSGASQTNTQNRKSEPVQTPDKPAAGAVKTTEKPASAPGGAAQSNAQQDGTAPKKQP
ncbi:MAG: poly-gamma-glutamate biosynthesis capsule formation protein [Paenibacillus sp.]|nr:poly-gamma-glutamate biosynthesis capsule formation protein [Paenibacillus sp.]